MNKLVLATVVSLAAMCFYRLFNDGFDPESIRGKRVLVTGTSSGIGEQLAYEYCKLGAKVFITARRAKLLQQVARRCRALGAQQVEFEVSDLAEQEDRDRVMATLEARLGGLDHLVLNHAIASPNLWLGTRENMTKFRYELDVNFVSFVDLASQALPLLTSSQGSIGVVSSVAGKVPMAGVSGYSAAKHALQGFFSALRQELRLRRTGVSVTTCVIGPVDTANLRAKKAVHGSIGGFEASAQDTAVAILRGVATRDPEIYYGRVAWVAVTLHKLLPGYVENLSGRLCLEMHNITV